MHAIYMAHRLLFETPNKGTLGTHPWFPFATRSASGLCYALCLQFMSFLASHKPRIILGTRSSSRQLLMQQLMKDYPYETRTADIDEKAIRCKHGALPSRQDLPGAAGMHLGVQPVLKKSCCCAGEKPEDLVMKLAFAKADAIKTKMAAAGEDCTTGYLLTCDQVRCMCNQVLPYAKKVGHESKRPSHFVPSNAPGCDP